MRSYDHMRFDLSCPMLRARITLQCTFAFPDYCSLRLYQTFCKHVASKPTLTNARQHTPPITSESPKGVDDAIDREFNDLFDQWRKLTSETVPVLFERSEIDESALLGKAIPHPAQVNSVK